MLKITPKAQKKMASFQEAMSALQNVHWKKIARGRVVARQIAMEKVTCTTREIINAMVAEGSLVAGAEKEHWVSRVWRNGEWVWTGKVAAGKTHNTQGGIRWSKVWRLK